jgi:hypothetical protein
MTERLVLVARLKPEAHHRAETLAGDLRADPTPTEFRPSVFLSPTEVVFVIEGEDAERHTRDWFNDPVLSTAIAPWLPLFDEPLHAAREVFP